MANIPGAKVKMNDIEIAQESALSEATFTKMGANINALIDEDVSLQSQITTNANNIATNVTNISTVSNRHKILESSQLTASKSTSVLGFEDITSYTFNFSGEAAIGFLLHISAGTWFSNPTFPTGYTKVLLNGVSVYERTFDGSQTLNFSGSGAFVTTFIAPSATNSVQIKFQNRSSLDVLTNVQCRLAKIAF
jgi:hypothetical protein